MHLQIKTNSLRNYIGEIFLAPLHLIFPGFLEGHLGKNTIG
jgi:hypothetical protein